MRALRLHGNRDLRLEELTAADGPGPRQVAIEPLWCGICGTDLHEYRDGPIYCPREPHPLTGAALPQTLGHELSARVTAVGSEVGAVSEGDLIAVMPIVHCGRCRACARGRFEQCALYACTGLSTASGGFAEAGLIEDYQAFPLPAGASARDGALLEPAAVAVTALRRGRIESGSTVLVTGAGPIGSLVAVLARHAGAAHVVVTEPSQRRREWLQGAGIADRAIDPLELEPSTAIAELTDGWGADLAVECSGTAPGLADCVAALGNGGTLVQVGLFGKTAEVDPFAWCMKNLRIEAVVNHQAEAWMQLRGMLAGGGLDLDRVITDVVDLDATVDAFERLLEPDCAEVKVLVQVAAEATA